MIIGKMDELLTFKSQTRTVDEYGGVSASTGTTIQKWSQVNYLAGKKGYETEQLIAQMPVEIFTRYDSTITTDFIIVIDNDDYFISSIQEINRKEGLRILARLQTVIN